MLHCNNTSQTYKKHSNESYFSVYHQRYTSRSLDNFWWCYCKSVPPCDRKKFEGLTSKYVPGCSRSNSTFQQLATRSQAGNNFRSGGARMYDSWKKSAVLQSSSSQQSLSERKTTFSWSCYHSIWRVIISDISFDVQNKWNREYCSRSSELFCSFIVYLQYCLVQWRPSAW